MPALGKRFCSEYPNTCAKFQKQSTALHNITSLRLCNTEPTILLWINKLGQYGKNKRFAHVTIGNILTKHWFGVSVQIVFISSIQNCFE